MENASRQPATRPAVEAAAPATCTAFSGARRIATGPLATVALAAKRCLDGGETQPILVFDDMTSQLVEIDFRGAEKDVQQRLSVMPQPDETAASETAKGPGRPRLGVVSREVTLLPRHWEWLNSRPGGASVALRKLVDEARLQSAKPDRLRQAREATYKFMAAMAGNEAGFEEACRALFAGKRKAFEQELKGWPKDIAAHAKRLAALAFEEGAS